MKLLTICSSIYRRLLDLESVLTSPCLPPYLRPQGLLLGLPVGAALE